MPQVANDYRGFTSRGYPARCDLIPAGTILRVPDGLADAAGLVEVEWDGETVQVFAVDVRDSGELIKAMSATGGTK